MSYTPKQLAQSYPEKTAAALSEMILLNKVLALKSFRQIIFNPKLSSVEEKDVVTKTLSQNFSQNLIDFLLLVIQENRLKEFDQIFLEFKKILKNDKIALSGTVTSAQAISEAEKQQIEQDLTKKIGTPIILETIVKPELLGGVVINVDGETFDNSYKYKLSKLK